MKKSIGKIIGKLIFLGLEVLAAWVLTMTIMSFDFGQDFLMSVIISVFAAYLFSGIVIIIVWIFNFATEFDDYDDFGEGMSSLKIAPLTLVIHIFKHLFSLIGYLFEKETPYVRPFDNADNNVRQINKEKENDPVRDERSTTLFADMVNKKAKAIASRPPIGNYIHSNVIHVEWEYGRANVSVAPWGKITFSGTVVFRNTLSHDEMEYDTGYIEECLDETAELLIERMSDAIDDVQREYNGYDKEYSINTSLSYRTINMILR
ncbi:MAG: hypothetical protein IJ012_04305 [Clostridia bacterium]|nr:hypothetical protein [Clostridia bacterium]